MGGEIPANLRGSDEPVDAAPPSVSIELPAGSEPDWLALPARPGVVAFEGATGRTTLLASTADMRNLARARLGAAARTDHRSITHRVTGYEAGSSLEADVIYLAQARARMPDMHRLVGERWRAWFVHIDASAEHPEWTRVGLGAAPTPRAGRLLGPLATKESAARLIERLIDAFDLCREHHLLVQAPRARACPYKEMGRCAAPCDGSEPMASYRTRVERAARLLVRGMRELRAALEADMLEASRRGEYERAAELKQQFVRVDGLMAPAFAHVGELSGWRQVFVVPCVAGAAGRARVLLLAGARLREIGTISSRPSDADLSPVVARLLEPATEGTVDVQDQAGTDTISAVTRWLYAPASRRRGASVRLAAGSGADWLGAELRAAAGIACRRRAGEAAAAEQVMESGEQGRGS